VRDRREHKKAKEHWTWAVRLTDTSGKAQTCSVCYTG